MRSFCNTDRGLSLYNKGRFTKTAQLYRKHDRTWRGGGSRVESSRLSGGWL